MLKAPEWTEVTFPLFRKGVPIKNPEIHPDALGVELEIEYAQSRTWLANQGLYYGGVVRELSGTLRGEFPQEGSLRGKSFEWASPPMLMDEMERSLYTFQDILKRHHVKIKPSHRMGTHVHLNFQGKSQEQVAIFASLYYIFEPMFLELAGPSRQNNCFCLSSLWSPKSIRNALSQGGLLEYAVPNSKYASLNLMPLEKLGTVEVRLLPGHIDAATTTFWVRLFDALRKVSLANFKTLKDVQTFFNRVPVEDFLSFFFGADAEAIRKMLRKKPVRELLLEGYNSSFFILSTDAVFRSADKYALEYDQLVLKRQKEFEEAIALLPKVAPVFNIVNN
jgi:hypothetical protein